MTMPLYLDDSVYKISINHDFKILEMKRTLNIEENVNISKNKKKS